MFGSLGPLKAEDCSSLKNSFQWPVGEACRVQGRSGRLSQKLARDRHHGAKSKDSLGRNGKRMTSPWELMLKC